MKISNGEFYKAFAVALRWGALKALPALAVDAAYARAE